MKVEEWLELHEVKPGMTLAKDVESGGQVILTSGLVFSEEILSLLQGMDIPRIPVLTEVEDEPVVSLVDPEAVIFTGVRDIYHLLKLIFQKSCKTGALDPESISVLCAKIEALAEKGQECDLFQLVKASGVDRYDIAHTVNRLILCLLLSDRMGHTREERRQMALSAAFADMGNILIDRQLLCRKERLTKQEYLEVRRHIFMGVTLMKNCFSLEGEVLLGLVQHHERYNGSGYPRGLTGDEIHPVSLAIGLADMFDALIADRPYRKAYSLYDAMRLLLSVSGSLFPPHLVNSLFKLFTFYPPNTTVRLNTGEIGTVAYVSNESVMRPTVKVCFDHTG
ncbi:MAG: hypothetical protein PHQ23_12215, partial [Candidatus Wallbacteria bacterium]|nr:hypothetical protein [Candidatus Wallbacteria bacterium]